MRKRGLIIAVLGFISAACCLAGAFFAVNVKADTELSGVLVPTFANYGSELALPDAQIVVDGQTYAAQAVIRYPSGAAYRKTSAVLSEEGVYTVEYRATVNGKIVKVEKEVIVRKNLFSVKKETDSAEYKENTFVGRGGVVVSLGMNSMLEYNRVIDLSKTTIKDNVVELYADYDKVRGAEFYGLTVKLTDIYDENNVVTVYFDGRATDLNVANRAYSDVRAGAGGQTLSGWNRYEKKLYVGTRGSWVRSSFKDVDNLTSPIIVRYVADEKAVYGNNNIFIIDFDDPQYFSELWGGFTTGEVKLSISANQIADKTADFVITGILDEKLADDHSMDTEPPVIEIEDSGYAEAPAGAVNVAYPVFNATAFDAYCGESPVEIAVYAAYDSSARNEIAIINGKFTPKHDGVYTVVYTSTDLFGNKAEKLVRVNVVKTLALPEITLGEKVESGICGTIIKLASAEYVSYSGNAETNVKVTLNGNVICENQTQFMPEKAGTYKVTYTASDYLGRETTEEDSVAITTGENPVFIGAPVLPKYLLTGSEYVFPEFNGYLYTNSGKQTAETTVKVSVDGEETVLSGRKYKVDLSLADKTVKLIYAAGNTQAVYSLPVVGAKKSDGIDMAAYFAGGDVTKTATSDGILLSAVKDGATTTFANALYGEKLNFSFTVNGNKNKFGGLKIRLIDSEDASSSVTFKVTKGVYGSGQSYVELNGIKALIGCSFFGDTPNRNFYIEYNNSDCTITDGNTFTLTVNNDDEGNKFGGFASGKVYMEITFENVTGESEINFANINGQKLSTDKRDRVVPLIGIKGEAEGMYALNSKVKTFEVIAADVLDPNVKVTLSILAPSGGNLVQNGITYYELATDVYEITLSEYGYYVVEITATDTSKKYDVATYVFYVADRVPPVIKVSGSVVKEAKVNAKVTVPSATATDNCDESVTVYAFYVNPDKNLTLVTNGSFTPNKAGKWKVVYYAFDEFGNSSVVTYEITVK